MLREKEANELHKLINNEIASINKTKFKIEFPSKVFNYVNIHKGKSCSKCFKNIDNLNPQFYCYWCDIHFCDTCGGTYELTKQGLQVLPHFHNLIFINVKKESQAMKNIEISRLGSNKIFSCKPENLTNHHNNNQCHGCGEYWFPITGIRYICLSCSDFFDCDKTSKLNYCEHCIDICYTNSEDKFNALNRRLLINQHDPKTHIFLVLYYAIRDDNKY